MQRWSLHILCTGLSLIWCAALVIPPVLSSLCGPSSAAALQSYAFFRPVCHQIDSHSLHLFGYPLGVCARCFGIYSGFTVGAVLAFRLRRAADHPRIWWSIAVLPMLADVILHVTGVHTATMMTRLVTGGIFGILAALILLPLLAEYSLRPRQFFNHHPGAMHESQT